MSANAVTTRATVNTPAAWTPRAALRADAWTATPAMDTSASHSTRELAWAFSHQGSSRSKDRRTSDRTSARRTLSAINGGSASSRRATQEDTASAEDGRLSNLQIYYTKYCRRTITWHEIKGMRCFLPRFDDISLSISACSSFSHFYASFSYQYR